MRRRTSPPNVTALERGFEVLNCFASAGRPLGNGDVALATGIPRPTAYRLISTLVSLGQLRACPDSDKYELAAGVVRLAQSFLGAIDARRWVKPHLVGLAETCGASAFLGMRDGRDVLVVEAARARSAVAFLGADVGTRMSLASSALGRAWLAGVDPLVCNAVIAEMRKLDGYHAGPRLESVLRKTRREGYAISLGEWHTGTNAAAVPVSAPSGEVFSINCGGPSFLLTTEKIHDLVVPHLRLAAAAFAADIGGIAGHALTTSYATSPRLDKAERALPASPAKRRRSNNKDNGDQPCLTNPVLTGEAS
jgi:DNA-binding IclR family transcriptional regulator